MTWQFNAYVPLMLAAGAISSAVAVFTLRQRHSQGSIALAVRELRGDALGLGHRTSVRLGLLDVRGGISQAGVLRHGHDRRGHVRVRGVVFGPDPMGHARECARSLLAPRSSRRCSYGPATTTRSSGRRSSSTPAAPWSCFTRAPGVWWWVDTAYTYLLLAAAVALLVRMFFKEPGLYRRQATALIAAVVVPVAADVVYVYGAPSAETANLDAALLRLGGAGALLGFRPLPAARRDSGGSRVHHRQHERQRRRDRHRRPGRLSQCRRGEAHRQAACRRGGKAGRRDPRMVPGSAVGPRRHRRPRGRHLRRVRLRGTLLRRPALDLPRQSRPLSGHASSCCATRPTARRRSSPSKRPGATWRTGCARRRRS